MTFSNEAEEKYAEFQESYDQMDNRVVADPICDQRIKALETSLKNRCEAYKKIIDDLVKAVNKEDKEATLTCTKYIHYTTIMEEIKKEYQSDLKNILKELLSLDPAKHDSYKVTFDTHHTYFNGQWFTVLSGIASLEVEPPPASSTHNNTQQDVAPVFNSDEFADALSRGLSNLTLPPSANSGQNSTQKYKYKSEDVPKLKEDVKDYP